MSDPDSLKILGCSQIVNGWIEHETNPIDQYALPESISVRRRGNNFSIRMLFPDVVVSPELSCLGRSYNFSICEEYESHTYLSAFPTSNEAKINHDSIIYDFILNEDQIKQGIDAIEGHNRFACYTTRRVGKKNVPISISIVDEIPNGENELKIIKNKFGDNRILVSKNLIRKPIYFANTKVTFRKMLVTPNLFYSIPSIKIYVLGKEGMEIKLSEFEGRPVPLLKAGELPDKNATGFILEDALIDNWSDRSRLIFADNCKLLRQEAIRA